MQNQTGGQASRGNGFAPVSPRPKSPAAFDCVASAQQRSAFGGCDKV